MSPEPGWYTDQNAIIRWWDGAAWTAHTRPEPGSGEPSGPGRSAQPVQPGRRRSPLRRAGLVVAAVLVVALVAAGAVVARTAFGPVWRITASDPHYAYTDPQHVSADAHLLIPTALPGSGFTLYADRSLTAPVDVVATRGLRPHTLDLVPVPAERGCPSSAEWGCDVQAQLPDTGPWGIRHSYWLVRSSNEADGSPLDRPIVTEVVVDRPGSLDSPELTVSTDAKSNLEVSWNEVDGATGYRIVWESVNQTVRDVTIGTATGTSWTVPDADTAVGFRQNAALYRVGQDVENDALCVVATHGDRLSGCVPLDITQLRSQLPGAHDPSAQAEAGPVPLVALDDLSNRFYYTALDGSRRSVTALVAAADDGAEDHVVVSGAGTALSYEAQVTGATPEAITAFNRESVRKGGVSGTDVTVTSVDEDSPDYGSADAPSTDLPVRGSSDMVRYLAQQMIGHTERIDITAWTGPGNPDARDAAEEAIWQNPYVFRIGGVFVSDTTVTVTYDLPADEYADLQDAVKAKVDEVVASQTDGSMSDREKVVALNDWLVDNVAYDWDAVEADDTTGSIDGYEASFEADGALLHGVGVCASYAAAFALLTEAAGVESVVVTGYLPELDGYHAWNKVELDGSWWVVDTTWNDSEGAGDDNDFLIVTEGELTGDAARTEDDDWMVDTYIDDYATP